MLSPEEAKEEANFQCRLLILESQKIMGAFRDGSGI
jgi:hypothetical protein